ncbi:GNAT family N-acetyltransferase [Streptomyces sp. NPDC007107]|uniref:GNAT family N-acetyltransferase n=1 Tax=Streptomyces sp. NPDC007107 TaxID=3156915 RepID=UPI0033DBF37F
MRIRLVEAASLPSYADGIRQVYADVFSEPPWNEDPSAGGRYVERLAADATRPGFTAALALGEGTVGGFAEGTVGGFAEGSEGSFAEGTVGGFATAWTTPDVFPSSRSYGHVAEALGPGRAEGWLCGALEVDELAVSPDARGAGLGAALLSAVTEAAPDGRCWLLTSVHAEATLRFYRRAGWHQVPVSVPGRAGLVVLLGPRHPAARP